MTSGRNHSLNTPAIYIQPNNFADYLSHQRDYCLFLDIDGTLADFTLDPKNSIIPNATLLLLQRIQNYGVKVAIVTGRSLAEAKQMLSPLQLPIAATHGLEITLNGSFNDDLGKPNDNNVSTVHVDKAELTAIRQIISQYSTSYSDLTIENKPYSVALHFRKNPTLANVAHTIMLKTLSNYANWTLKQGKYVWEIVPKGADKGTAILTLLEKMQTDKELFAIFIGDDITDEAGFITVQNENRISKNKAPKNKVSKNKVGEKRAIQKFCNSVKGSAKGMGIKVGSEPTCAHYYVHNIHEVTVLLDNFLSFCQFVFYQKNASLSSDLADANIPLLKEQQDASYEPINRLI